MNYNQDRVPSSGERDDVQAEQASYGQQQPQQRRRRTQAQEINQTQDDGFHDTVVRGQKAPVARGSRAAQRAPKKEENDYDSDTSVDQSPDNYRDEMVEYEEYSNTADFEPPEKHHYLRWGIIIALVLALLAGATYIGTQRPDLIEPVVRMGRELLGGATASPEPTVEPTPEPTPEPTAPPAVTKEMAKVIGMQADPSVQPNLDQPVYFQITTTLQTDRVRVVNNNGETLAEAEGADNYTETEFGRVWRLGVYFIDPYKGEVEANPGNAADWNEMDSYTTLIEVGSVAAAKTDDTPDVYPDTPQSGEVQAQGGEEEVVSVAPPAVVDPTPASVTGNAYSGKDAVTDFTRETPISFADQNLYRGSTGMKGVLAYRGSGMRQNAAFGTVMPMTETLISLWEVPAGKEGGTEYRTSAQALIVQWHLELRKLMEFSPEKQDKQSLREVIFPSNDGYIYFFDLDDGLETRVPLASKTEQEIAAGLDVPLAPMLGAAAVYPRGFPVLAVGAGVPGDPSVGDNGGLEIYNLISRRRAFVVRTKRDEAITTDYSMISSPLFDTQTGTVIAAGANGLLYTMTLKAAVDVAQSQMTLDASLDSLQMYASSAGDKSPAVYSSPAAYGEYAYYASQDGILQAVNVNTLTTAWALDLGLGVSGAVTLDLETADAAAPTLYVSTVADDTGYSYLHRIDAADGSVKWTIPLSGSVDASMLIGEGEIATNLYAAASNGTTVSLYAIDKLTGEIAWQQELQAKTAAAPIALYGDVEQQGGVWIVQGADSNLNLLNGVTGELMNTLDMGAAVIGSPAAYDDKIVVATADGMLHCVQIQ